MLILFVLAALVGRLRLHWRELAALALVAALALAGLAAALASLAAS